MSGHSKWNNIKRKKGAADAAKGKIFTKLGREIQMIVKAGGADPESNSRLKDVIAKAKSQNMPNDTILRSIKKAAGADNSENYEDIQYEGYGPSGVAVMVHCLTDNRNRTAADVRHIFDRHGGNMGTNGCVAFLFEQKGSLVVDMETQTDEESVMMAALEAGAEDVEADGEVYVITTAPEDFYQVRDKLTEAGFTFVDSSVGPVPNTWVKLEKEEQKESMMKLIDGLEDLDDVQDVYHNWDYEA